MKVFIYLLPKDISLIKKFSHPHFSFYPWVEKSLLSEYLKNGLDSLFLVYDEKSEEGEASLGDTNKKIKILSFKNKKDLAKRVLKDKDVFIKTQDFGIIWNYSVSGFLVNPYQYLMNKELPLPNGKVLPFEKATNVGRRWLAYLGEQRSLSQLNHQEKLTLILKSLFVTCKMNLEMRKGKIKEPELPKFKPLDPNFNPKVASRRQNMAQTTQTRKKAVITTKIRQERKKKGECPFGDNCEYKKRGLLCLHNKDFAKLAKFFRTRDLDLIMEGLAQILQEEASRYEKGIAIEKLKSSLDPLVTAIGQNLFQRAVEYLKILKPELVPQTTYNILNQRISVGVAVKKLEQAGLSDRQRQDLAEEIDTIIKEEKHRRVERAPVVAQKS